MAELSVLIKVIPSSRPSTYFNRSFNVFGVNTLPDGRLILCDRGDTPSLQLFNTDGDLVDRLELPGKPLNLAVISNVYVVVTLHPPNKLQFITVAGQTLVLGRAIRTTEGYHGVAYCDNQLIVTHHSYTRCNERPVVIMDIFGNEVRTLKTGCYTSMSVTANPLEKVIYVNGNCSLVCVTLDGSVLTEYKHKPGTHLEGMTVHPDGSVYVCGFTSNCIYHHTTQSTLIATLLGSGEVQHPQAICFSPSGDKLFVAEWTRDKIKVFRLLK